MNIWHSFTWQNMFAQIVCLILPPNFFFFNLKRQHGQAVYSPYSKALFLTDCFIKTWFLIPAGKFSTLKTCLCRVTTNISSNPE